MACLRAALPAQAPERRFVSAQERARPYPSQNGSGLRTSGLRGGQGRPGGVQTGLGAEGAVRPAKPQGRSGRDSGAAPFGADADAEGFFRTFRTTNCIENVNGLFEQLTHTMCGAGAIHRSVTAGSPRRCWTSNRVCPPARRSRAGAGSKATVTCRRYGTPCKPSSVSNSSP